MDTVDVLPAEAGVVKNHPTLTPAIGPQLYPDRQHEEK
jgi:hypothetical protein